MNQASSSAPCACTALRKATRAVSRVYDDALAAAGLTTTQFAILRTIVRLGEPPLSRLAEALVMDRTSLYRTLRPMMREGWVAIRASGGRSKTARITPRGRARMNAAAFFWQTTQKNFVQRFGARAWKQMNDGLQRMVLLFAEQAS